MTDRRRSRALSKRAGRVPRKPTPCWLAPIGERLAPLAGELRDAGWGRHVTYSRKVFVPLTHLCRDVCHYCTFARSPRRTDKGIPDARRCPRDRACRCAGGLQGSAVHARGQARGALRAAREALADLGHESTLSYLREVAQRVLDETGSAPAPESRSDGCRRISPHCARSRRPWASCWRPRRSACRSRAARISARRTKLPARRLETIRLAGEMRVPLTTGILIGIGETRRERIDALLALRELAERHGHIQEIIVQNFRAKPGTKMHDAPQPSMDDLCWTIAVARLIFGPSMSIQAPPNLYSGDLADPIAAGINDWGGVSPVTPDHVNPEAPWPHLDRLAARDRARGPSAGRTSHRVSALRQRARGLDRPGAAPSRPAAERRRGAGAAGTLGAGR